MTDVFETHFHLYPTDDLTGILQRAADSGVSRLLVAGASPDNLPWLVKTTAAIPGLYAAVGIHPHEAEKFDGDLSPYHNWLRQAHIPAVGEIGLDYHYDFADRQAQLDTFETFLGLARETTSPSIIHCRKAEQDCYDCLRDILAGQPFVVHCYTGSREWAYRFLDLGGYLSFTGIITFKGSQELRDLVADLPEDRIFFETDSPYLAPVPHRGTRNEPAHVPLVVACAAEARHQDPDQLNAQATANALRFFQIGADAPHLPDMKTWQRLTQHLLDTHCHLFDYEPWEPIAQQTQAAGMRLHVMSQAPEEFQQNAQRTDPNWAPAALGLFPTLITPDNLTSLLADFAKLLPRTHLIGEIGLDFVTPDPALRTAQQQALAEILQLCNTATGRILSVHSRRAAGPTIELLRTSQNPAILHWFSGTPQDIASVPSHIYFSVNPAMIRSRSKRALLAAMPRDRVLLESDGPYVTYGTRPVVPLDLRHVAERLASLWSLPLPDTVQQLAENGRRIAPPPH